MNKTQALLIYFFCSLVVNCERVQRNVTKEVDPFFRNWEKLCNELEVNTEIGLILKPKVESPDTAWCLLQFGIPIYGFVYIDSERVYAKDLNTNKSIVLFDFNMKPGEIFRDTALRVFQFEQIIHSYSVELKWKRLDTCIQDTVFMFEFTPDFAHFSNDDLEDWSNLLMDYNRSITKEVYFVGAKSGVLGWAHSKMLYQPEDGSYRLNPYGKQYFSPEDHLESSSRSKIFRPDSAIRYFCTKELLE